MERLIYIFPHPAQKLNSNFPLFTSSGGILNHEESEAMVAVHSLQGQHEIN
jgi:hypothetical protein